MECIGRGKARAPYEFGCKVSIATPATAPKGGQFVLRAKALHGDPYVRTILAADFHGRFIHLRINDDGKLDYANVADATKRDTVGYVKR